MSGTIAAIALVVCGHAVAAAVLCSVHDKEDAARGLYAVGAVSYVIFILALLVSVEMVS